jgi:hypothetical protein
VSYQFCGLKPIGVEESFTSSPRPKGLVEKAILGGGFRVGTELVELAESHCAGVSVLIISQESHKGSS